MPLQPREEFKDHFSGSAESYAAYRPTYPAALVDFLADVAPSSRLAWDCGCGSGQMSMPLARRFERVVATDASTQQLAQAAQHPRVEYRVGREGASGLSDGDVDLCVAAQAAHWFDLDAYYAEVRRVARTGGVVALVTYGNVAVDRETDPVIVRFYSEVLGRFWPPERRHIEAEYRSLPFPFEEVAAPAFPLREAWTLDQLLGYIETWSALREIEKTRGREPFETFRRELAAVWGPAETIRTASWPLSMRVGRIR